MLPDATLNALYQRIARQVPTGGFFRTDAAKDEYIAFGLRLLDGGYSEDDIVDWLSALYGATAEEFGG